MLTQGAQQTYDGLSESAKTLAFALSVLIDRIGSLPRADRDDLFELVQALGTADTAEERRDIRTAMEEVLAQVPVTVRPFPLAEEGPEPVGLAKWSRHVGGKIRELREQAGLTQTQLAEKAGLTQSHISRLENAEHSATNKTLEKVASALGVGIGEIDPCSE